MHTLFEWQSPSHFHTEKKSNWYWVVGAVVIIAAVVSVIFGNLIFGILIVIAGATLVLQATHEPMSHVVRITDEGVVIDNTIYSYQKLEAFWFDSTRDTLLLRVSESWIHFVTIIVPAHVDIDAIRQELLAAGLREEEMQEPFTQVLMERLGF